MSLALVVATLGRVEPLRRLFHSLSAQLRADDIVVVVAQDRVDDVEHLASTFRTENANFVVITSPRGASRGRNAGVDHLPVGQNFLLNFPNDTTWFPPGTLDALRALPAEFSVGALTVVDENGPKFELPTAGTPLDRWNVWSVIEMGIVIRRALFDELGGFDNNLGTGATTPWQAGEATDLMARVMRSDAAAGFVWLPRDLHVGGVSDPAGLTRGERRRKLRGYGRGLGRVVTRWRYPLWWRFAFIAGGLAFGLRNRRTFAPLDGWWVFLGRFEGALGRTLGRTTDIRAVSR